MFLNLYTPHKIIFFFALLLVTSCFSSKKGKLKVLSLEEGNYDIYRFVKGDKVQLVADSSGYFNKSIELEPGSYRILADCSSEEISIEQDKETILKTHHLSFLPPLIPTENDQFSIQCSRLDETRSRQNIRSRFSLNVLPGNRDLLIGMIPFQFKLDQTPGDSNSVIQDIKLDLSAILVVGSHPLLKNQKQSYFISPAQGLISVTEPQSFGSWQFLLPGDYEVEVNGTKTLISLKEKETKTIETAMFLVSSPKEANLLRSTTINGSPPFVEINQEKLLELNEVYALLPGSLKFNIGGANYAFSIALKENELTEIKTKAVQVNLSCPEKDLACLGSKQVFLYRSSSNHPFMSGSSDAPLLFVDDAESYSVSLEGIRNLKHRISKKERTQNLNTNTLTIKPLPAFKQGVITDLVRIETFKHSGDLFGETLDLPLDRETKVNVFYGSFQLVEYLTINAAEGVRTKKVTEFSVSSGTPKELAIQVFLSEKKFKSLKK